uniref:Uncharacterized protein n=1 Tax=Anguilla anguilla TaxID=7936 RepID=A0A0E9W6H8_ANGAN
MRCVEKKKYRTFWLGGAVITRSNVLVESLAVADTLKWLQLFLFQHWTLNATVSHTWNIG